MRKRTGQLALDLRSKPRWGGRREGAGQKRGGKRYVPHARRAKFPGRYPCHLTLKVRPGIASLRIPQVVREIETTFAKVCERARFRLLHYSIQDDHAHLIVEAEGREVLGRAMKSLAARFARAVNRSLRRVGPVLKERYHLEVLETPRQVRNALAYVLLNARKHLAERLARRGKTIGATPLDPASSGRWFEGWRRGVGAAGPDSTRRRTVAHARTWLLSVGWRRHGLIDLLEVPGPSRPRAQ